MIQQLENLIRSCGKLSVTLTPATGDKIKLVIAPAAQKGKDAALAHPLALTGTAAELDAELPTILGTYQETRASLASQIEATETILNNAKASSANKAVNALKGKATTATPAPKATIDSDDNDEGDGSDSSDDSSNDEAAMPVTSAAPEVTGTDLASLI